MLKSFKMQMPGKVQAALADSDFRVHARNAIDDQPAELLIMDEIGENFWGGGIAATEVVSFVNENAGKPIKVRINSFGGSVYDGFVMLNTLLQHDAEVTTIVEGVAYSAASVVFMAGHHRKMHETSDLGLHRSLVGAMGNANMMRAIVEWLDTLDMHQTSLFQSVTGRSEEEINGWLDGSDSGGFGTVFPATEANELGFITELIPLKRRNEEPDAVEDRLKQNFATGVNAKIKAHNDAIKSLRRRKHLTQ